MAWVRIRATGRVMAYVRFRTKVKVRFMARAMTGLVQSLVSGLRVELELV
jgi:hypothetical protein